MWSAIAPVLFAVIGWLFIGFLGKPFLDFQNLKGQVHEAIVLYGEHRREG